MLSLQDKITMTPAPAGASYFVSGSQTGRTIDIAGFHSAVWLCAILHLNGIRHVELEHSDDASSWSKVPNDQLLGRDETITQEGRILHNNLLTHKILRIGLLSKKRYQRAILIDAGASQCMFTAALILGRPTHLPARAPITV